MPQQQAKEILYQISRGDEEKVLKTWLLWARADQYVPEGDWWRIWLLIAGRGFGKTRTGAECVRHWAKHNRFVNLIGATSDDARDIMIEGESGILSICSKDDRPTYIANRNILKWPNGCQSLIWTADRPDRLRGKQSDKLWMDELAAWRYPESYDQAMLGLRLGKSPQAVISTTPRPIKIIKDLVKDPTTFITRGSTYANKANLAKQFIDQIVKRYEGTRLGRQELDAEILDDNPSALFKRDNIDKNRVKTHPQLTRVVVALDPSVTNSEASNECGIIVLGRGVDDRGYVLADYSRHASPEGWARIAVNAYHEFKANFIVAEVNNGGDLVEFTIRTIDKYVAYTSVHASRGKAIRAEPISSLYEQDKISHVGSFPILEEQMCEWDPSLPPDPLNSPDRMDALVWGFTKLFIKDPKPLLLG